MELQLHSLSFVVLDGGEFYVLLTCVSKYACNEINLMHCLPSVDWRRTWMGTATGDWRQATGD
jgi:hypothetical protein